MQLNDVVTAMAPTAAAPARRRFSSCCSSSRRSGAVRSRPDAARAGALEPGAQRARRHAARRALARSASANAAEMRPTGRGTPRRSSLRVARHRRRHRRGHAPAHLRAVLHDQGDSARAPGSACRWCLPSFGNIRDGSPAIRKWAAGRASTCTCRAGKQRRNEPRRLDADAARAGKETVLVVDDEEMIRRVAALTLKTHGYSVLEAADGQQAVDL